MPSAARPTSRSALRGDVVWQALRAALDALGHDVPAGTGAGGDAGSGAGGDAGTGVSGDAGTGTSGDAGTGHGAGPGSGARARPRALSVVDVGGGSGGLAVPLAELGHDVLVVDPSPDSLASLQRRAEERGVAGRVHARQGDLSSLLDHVPAGSADAVVCHSVLEVVDDPADSLRVAVSALRPGGLASLVVANRVAAVLARAVAGHVEEAAAAFADPAGRWGAGDAAVRRFDTAQLLDLAAGAGLVGCTVHGARVFVDLVPGALLDVDPDAAAALLQLERDASGQPPFRDIATSLHLLGRRP